MKKHIFEIFISNNFENINIKNKKIKGITLLFGSPGSGKTKFIKEYISNSKTNFIYIGQYFEKDKFEDETSINFNEKHIFLPSYENEEIDLVLLEIKINKLIKNNYTIYFDEVFWEKKYFYQMIERLIIENKKADLFFVMNNISEDNFKYEQIAKYINNILIFKNNIFKKELSIYDYQFYSRLHVLESLNQMDIENFKRN